MKNIVRYLPIKNKENPDPRLVIFSFMLMFLSVVLLIINTLFLFSPSSPALENISNFAVWGLIVGFFFYCTTESRLVVSANILISITMMVIFLTMIETGGLFSVDKVYCIILICAAFLFAGKMTGILYSVITVAGMTMYYYGEKAQIWSHARDEQVVDSDYVYMSFISAIVVASIILFALIKLIEVLEENNKMLTLANILALENKLEQKSEEVISLKNDIARDFHDMMGNKLASISTISQVLIIRNENNVWECKDEIQRINVLSREVYDGTKDFIWALDAKHNNLLQIYFYLVDFGERLFQYSSIDLVSSTIDEDLEKVEFSSFCCAQYILIMKEAMTNVLMHSKAINATLTVQKEYEFVKIILTDDGVGFDASSLSRVNGLQNMKIRARRADAEFAVESTPGAGTQVLITIRTGDLNA